MGMIVFFVTLTCQKRVGVSLDDSGEEAQVELALISSGAVCDI
jgi:hypothetical protein